MTNLRIAINELADIFDLIGNITISQMAALPPSLSQLVEHYQKGSALLEKLADDEIPF